jgi:biopolymer transport protein ExbD
LVLDPPGTVKAAGARAGVAPGGTWAFRGCPVHAMPKPRAPRTDDDRDEGSSHLVPIMNVMLLMIPALLLAMEVAQMSSVVVSPPRFVDVPAGDPPTREPLLLRVAILEDGFSVKTAGAELGEGPGPTIPLVDPNAEGALRYDYAALEALARRLKQQHPEETVVTLGAEGSITMQTVVSTLDALRGRACSLRAPVDCMFFHPVIDGGAA